MIPLVIEISLKEANNMGSNGKQLQSKTKTKKFLFSKFNQIDLYFDVVRMPESTFSLYLDAVAI